MTFGRPDLLWLAFSLPLLITLGVFGFYRRRRSVARALGELDLVRRIGGDTLDAFPMRRLLFLAPASLLIGLAAAAPQWGTERVETQGRSLDIALVLDVSKSMLASDIEPNRLERQRLFAARFLRELAGDRIGLVVFAGRAYTLSPLTTDHSALLLYIDALDPEMVSQGGSSLASAISQATELLRGGNQGRGDRIIVLATDGEAHDASSAVINAAERARSDGILIHTVGIGSSAGAPVPELDTYGRITGYKRDPDTGETVISRLDQRLLQEVATLTGGSFTSVGSAGGTDALVARIRGLQRETAAGGIREVPRERFAWFIALALALVTLDAITARHRQRPGSPRASRPFVTASILLIATLAFGIGDLERGNRLYRQGRYEEAVEAYQRALRDGNDSPMLHYNLGTALLRLGRRQEAEEHLRTALNTVDPEERARALYNLGNRFLEAGIDAPDPRARDQMLDAAAEAYRDALRLDPDDLDAKWNLELTLRERENPPPLTGGGQQGQQDQQDQKDQDEDSSGQQDGPPGMSPPTGGFGDQSGRELQDPGEMSQAEAERLLSAIEQAERDLQRARLRKGRRDTPVARDW